MNLYEYQSKNLFSKFGLPVLKHWVCYDISNINDCVANINTKPPWVVKCQIQAGGRGKSGGVLLVRSKEEIAIFAKKWIGKPLITNQTAFSGEIVDSVLIEPAVKIVRELYVSMLIDPDSSKIMFMTAKTGGMNIETVISESPELLYKSIIDPVFANTYPYEGRIIASKLGLTGIQVNQFVEIYINIIRMFIDQDLMLIEINPLVITDENNLICLDSKLIVDDNSLFRQSELLGLYQQHKSNTITMNNLLIPDPVHVNYVCLNGNIGCMVNGAGLAMATMDLIKLLGGSPANFLDIGGDTNVNDIISALIMLFNKIEVKAVFINIFGGIVCCDLVARGIIEAISQCTTHIPVVVRLVGNNAELGSTKLINSNLKIFVINKLAHAIQKVITLVK